MDIRLHYRIVFELIYRLRNSFTLHNCWEEPSMDQCQTLEELSGPLVHTSFPRKRYGPMIGPHEFPPKLVWTNGTQSSLKVSVLTGIGP